MSRSNVARIEELENIEEKVIAILQTAGATLIEISKDCPEEKIVENNTQNFMTEIKSLEEKLSDQIRYLTQVSTGHPHEGSSYPSQKVLQTAWHRLEHAKSRISELDNHRNRLGTDSTRNTATSSATQKQGPSNSQHATNTFKQQANTSTSYQPTSSDPMTTGQTTIKPEMQDNK